MSNVAHEQHPRSRAGRRISITTVSPLAIVRLDRRLRQADVAARAGITRQHLGLLEAGRHTPTRKTAQALASALECDVAEIFPNAGGVGGE
jgi:transcriptional regulator with XRE-family HTH domain